MEDSVLQVLEDLCRKLKFYSEGWEVIRNRVQHNPYLARPILEILVNERNMRPAAALEMLGFVDFPGHNLSSRA